MNEDKLEQLCLDWFRDGGWDVYHGPDIAPDGPSPMRSGYNQVHLKSELESAFSRINPHLPADCFEQVFQKVSKPEIPDLIAANRDFHRLLLKGVPVEYTKDEKRIHDHAFLIDFDRAYLNRFAAIN